MKLDEAQRKKVADWIAQGLKLSEIQNRLASELNVSMTYMDVRLLVDDLKLTPKDTEPAKSIPSLQAPAAPTATAGASAGKSKGHAPAPSPGQVSVSVDQLARPGALVSGKVTFTDGVTAEWHLDQAGRLGLVPKQAGYRPPPADLQQFQMALENELAKLGF